MIVGQANGLTVRLVVPAQPLASVAVIVALPVAVGLPVMAPVEGLMLRPAGKLAAVQL